MRFRTPLIAFAAAATALPAIVAGGAATSAFAYGSASQPVAQVEISGNCDNPGFFFCSNVVGVGGIWAWAELENIPSSAVTGWNEMDATVADCSHVQGGAPPHAAGTGGGPDPIGVWKEFASLGDALAAAPSAEPLLMLGGPGAYTGPVYVLDFFPGTGSHDFEPVVPVAQGHYSAHPVSGVSLQIQVAP